METLHTTKIIKTGTSLGIVLPVAILNGLALLRGDRLVIAIGNNNTIILRKLSDKEIRDLKPDIKL